MTAEHWYEFHAYNTQKLYGYGTADEADRYQDKLNANRKINHYAIYRMSDEQVAELRLNDCDDTFALADELID